MAPGDQVLRAGHSVGHTLSTSKIPLTMAATNSSIMG